jgi:hypothetical protein
MLRLRADDRVLSLAIPSAQDAAAMARILISGCLVALGDTAEVDEARQALADFDNLMFVESRPDRIPWRDGFFTKILVPPHLTELQSSWASELHRVLAPGGEIVSNVEDA